MVGARSTHRPHRHHHTAVPNLWQRDNARTLPNHRRHLRWGRRPLLRQALSETRLYAWQSRRCARRGQPMHHLRRPLAHVRFGSRCASEIRAPTDRTSASGSPIRVSVQGDPQYRESLRGTSQRVARPRFQDQECRTVSHPMAEKKFWSTTVVVRMPRPFSIRSDNKRSPSMRSIGL